MPIYDYLCESCGFQQDVLQKMSDPRLTDCPQCKQPTLKKQLTAAGFQLKGSGWYVTDFREGAKKPSAPADSTKSGAADGANQSDSGAANPAANSSDVGASKQESGSSSSSSAPPAPANPAPTAAPASSTPSPTPASK